MTRLARSKIRLWNAMTGETAAKLAVQTHDHTIRVWKTTTREMVVGPFTGHTNSVLRVSLKFGSPMVVYVRWQGSKNFKSDVRARFQMLLLPNTVDRM